MSDLLALLVLASVAAAGCVAPPVSAAEEKGEMLANGIRLPEAWPPRQGDFADDPVTPPYLAGPPAVIPIDVGRQLFVDDFLIAETTLKRAFHTAEYHPATPVIKPEHPWEVFGGKPMATVFSDGVWFDPQDRLFKMWYYAGHGGGATCYAVSKDGVRWEKTTLDVEPGTNIVYKGSRDSGTVWLDHAAADPGERFKMALYTGGILVLFRSPDGIHWTKVADGGKTGDRSTFFYNPFRKRWVYSLRSSGRRGRSRHYWETPDFFAFGKAAWDRGEVVPWTASDSADWKREDMAVQPQLYNLDCAAYESLFVGLFSIWRGDYRFNQATEKAKELFALGRPKQNSVCIGFSRDGFHWDRPDRRPFCPTSEEDGAWNWGNMQSMSDVCLVVGDKLYFYVSGRAGKTYPGSSIHDAGGTTGLATLRRDGFASMDAGPEEGVLTTRPVTFTGKHLFVNVAAAGGELRAEVLDAGKSVAPFTRANCTPVRGDKTLVAVTWKRAKDLSSLAGKPVRFRFHLKSGSLYAFWVSPEKSGASHGYVAGGGPGFTGPTDTVGEVALKAAR